MSSHKFRPKRVFKNEKGLYYIVNKKKRYIKLDKNIDEKKLININIKNVLGYVKRKINKRRNKNLKIPGNNKGQTPMIHDITKSSSLFMYPGNSNNLLFNRNFLPQLTYMQTPPPSNSSTKDLTLLIQNLLESNKSSNNELKDMISNKLSTTPMILDKNKSPLTIGVKPSTSSVSMESGLTKRSLTMKTPVKPSLSMKTPVRPSLSSSVVEINDIGTSNNTNLKTLDDLNHNQLKALASKIKFEGTNDQKEFLKQPMLYNAKQTQALKTAIKNTKYLDNFDPESLDNLLTTQLGKGSYSNDDDGLYNDEISSIVKKHIPNYLVPVISSDEINTLLPYVNGNTDKFGFIMNLDEHEKPGSHWVAIFISRNEASVEYYDSLGNNPTKQFLKDIKPLIEKMNDTVYYILKINHVRDQSNDSNNCGYFAINFLDNRFAGKPWKRASLYDKVIDESKVGEKKIHKYKNFL